MKKVIIIPDSFKGTMSSSEICEIIGGAVKKFYPDCEIIKIPIADGGEGSIESFVNALGGYVETTVKNPLFEDVKAKFALVGDGKTAVVEMAQAAGLPLVKGRENPMLTTTYGVGQLISTAAGLGADKIILGLGGSATNDAGCGAAYALGVRFYDSAGEEMLPVGGTLEEVEQIDVSNVAASLAGARIVCMCDVENTMYGDFGASRTFAPQKGADENAVETLERGMKHFGDVIERELCRDVSGIPGGGAAGAMGAGMNAFFNAEIMSGIDTLLDCANFDSLLDGADLVISGEGRLDFQSLCGKVISGIAKRTKAAGVPLIAICGGVSDDADEMYDMGVSAVFTINKRPEDLSVSAENSAANLKFTIENILRYSEAIK